MGWGGVKIISSNDIMCHVHSHLPSSQHTGKILDGQSLVAGKRVVVVHNTYRKQKNLQARNTCSVQETVLSQSCKAQSFRHGFCPKLPQSGVIRRPPSAAAPWLWISDTVCLSAVIGPVLLSVKMCFWAYETVFKEPQASKFRPRRSVQ